MCASLGWRLLTGGLTLYNPEDGKNLWLSCLCFDLIVNSFPSEIPNKENSESSVEFPTNKFGSI